MSHEPETRPTTYIGSFLVGLTTLMYEILLTRIFSVTTWYHFAFVAISVGMFGMTAGALLVYLLPSYFPRQKTHEQLALSCYLFAVTCVAAFLGHLAAPLITGGAHLSLRALLFTYAVTAVPFVFCGICACLVLTRFPQQVGRLYAADLAGAAAGCVIVIAVLTLTDGPTAVFVVAALAAAAAAAFGASVARGPLFRIARATAVGLALFSAVLTWFVQAERPLLRLTWIKGEREKPARLDYEKWNSFARIRIWGDPARPEPPFGWGYSVLTPTHFRMPQLLLNIDGTAGSVLTAYHGNPAEVEYLKYDVVNIAHFLRPAANVLVIGTGGGRDILAALVFRQKSVVGVEVNSAIIGAITGRFADFTGRLYGYREVRLVADEARSYVTRQADRYDIIQISLTDTWAATAAGAFVLSENSLYTVEAWQLFLERLRPGGLLAVSRWDSHNNPGEIYRLVSLAAAALSRWGAAQPREHMALVANLRRSDVGPSFDRVGTLLVSNQPLSAADLAGVQRVADALRFDLLLSPRAAEDPNLAALASGTMPEPLQSNGRLRIDPPTDDSPFFFHLTRFRYALSYFREKGDTNFNTTAVAVLGGLLAGVLVLTSLCIIVPLMLTLRRQRFAGSWALFIFFGSIGFGFMLVEISQMQRLIVFLGHPTYGLSVVLFALLLSSGMGSWLWQRRRRHPWIILMALLLSLLAFGLLTPAVTHVFRGSPTPLRILIATATLSSIGLFMGAAFPIGMRIAAERSPALTPWFWGINGATSVCASVLAVVIAMSLGISAAFWTAVGFYGLAFLSYLVAARSTFQR